MYEYYVSRLSKNPNLPANRANAIHTFVFCPNSIHICSATHPHLARLTQQNIYSYIYLNCVFVQTHNNNTTKAHYRITPPFSVLAKVLSRKHWLFFLYASSYMVRQHMPKLVYRRKYPARRDISWRPGVFRWHLTHTLCVWLALKLRNNTLCGVFGNRVMGRASG